jgi:hypothetical protein
LKQALLGKLFGPISLTLIIIYILFYQFYFTDRPGFTRINLPYFMKKEEALFILESIVMIAEHGWKLLPKVLYMT